jgi:deoxycytidine triphosphate deaminase
MTDAVATLSAEAIRERLDPTHADPLVITPFIDSSLKGAGLDIRLGRKFIVFTKSGTGYFNPLDEDSDPRTMQEKVERWWSEQFIIHPGELVLATTLEYFVMPRDLACQVITRSSYGRLGLLTATAVLVHPNFKGCLTLELVNLGALPIGLRPGSRIAQLTFQKVSPPVEPPTDEEEEKYYCPTGPEFSKVHLDKDFAVLRNLGKRPG